MGFDRIHQATLLNLLAQRDDGETAVSGCPLLKFSALNAALWGWITYYRHSNAKGIAKDLDF